jgi:two-component system chemotaxis sensor kinase CheA
MSLDLAKYRAVFIEEATEHLSDMSTALLALEKSADDADAIDVMFRMAHGIKGMAASLEYQSITSVAHRLEDRMMAIRAAGIAGGSDLAVLFHGLDALEGLVAEVRQSGEAPPGDDPRVLGFEAAARSATEPPPKKKALTP